jgi:hypothetical protein
MKRSFDSSNQSLENFEKEAKYRVVDGEEFSNHEANPQSSEKDSMLTVPPHQPHKSSAMFQSTRFDSDEEGFDGALANTAFDESGEDEEFCLRSPSASSLDMTDPFTESIALEATPLQKITRLMQLMAQEERRKDERHNGAYDEAKTNQCGDDGEGTTARSTSTTTTSSSSTTPQPLSAFKRRKCDWLELLQNIAPFNDKRGYERIKEIGDGTFSRVISARKKGMAL